MTLVPFGKENLSHLQSEMTLYYILSNENIINAAFTLIHKSKLMPSNNNVIMNEGSEFALVYTINNEYEKVTRDELFKQIIYVKTKYINDLIIKVHGLMKYKINENDEKENYLLVRTGLLCDDYLFTKKELKKYEKIKKNNLISLLNK
jgi:hypothetical protein